MTLLKLQLDVWLQIIIHIMTPSLKHELIHEDYQKALPMYYIHKIKMHTKNKATKYIACHMYVYTQ